MLIVGLTGGIASGKSTVSSLLSSSYHTPLIDLDLLAREVVRPADSSGVLRALVRAFGEEILHPDGTLDRPALGRLCFGEGEEREARRRTLNAITHRAIRKRMVWKLVCLWLGGEKVAVVDAPLLVEAGLWKWCGQVVLVWCPPSDQLTRMLARDRTGPRTGLTEAEARTRLSSQWALDDKLPYADVVLDNSRAREPPSSGSETAAGSATAGGSEPAERQSAGSEAPPSLEAQVASLVSSWPGHAHAHAAGASSLSLRMRMRSLASSARWFLAWVVPPLGLLLGLGTVYMRRRRVARRLRSREGEGEGKGKGKKTD